MFPGIPSLAAALVLATLRQFIDVQHVRTAKANLSSLIVVANADRRKLREKNSSAQFASLSPTFAGRERTLWRGGLNRSTQHTLGAAGNK